MKDYPAFIIDRNRRSEASRFTDDFVVCTDKEVGFIARIFKVPKSRRTEMAALMDSAGFKNKYYAKIIDDSMIVLEIVRMFYEPVAHINRLPPLMKKAMNAYLFGEKKAVNRDSLPYDDQIAALDDILRLSQAQRPRLEDMNGMAATDRFIEAIRSARDTVVLMQKLPNNDYRREDVRPRRSTRRFGPKNKNGRTLD